ncbi:MAG: ligase-associated DNA damage response endonuclease PdeM [Stellaceae bacterium]
MPEPARRDEPQPIRLHGVDLLAAVEGALVWPEERTLIVADLHLEKGSSFARRGVMLPPYDTRATLQRLARVAARHDAQRIVCLGDSFHDGEAPARLDAADAALLGALAQAVELIWIAGNHDPAPPAGLGGRVVEGELRLGPLTFRHIAEPLFARGEVSGHFHPKASIDLRGRRLSGRCFVLDEHRLVLPAFGAYAGGLDVFEPALRALFPGDFAVHLLARDRVTPLPHARLAGFWRDGSF